MMVYVAHYSSTLHQHVSVSLFSQGFFSSVVSNEVCFSFFLLRSSQKSTEPLLKVILKKIYSSFWCFYLVLGRCLRHIPHSELFFFPWKALRCTTLLRRHFLVCRWVMGRDKGEGCRSCQTCRWTLISEAALNAVSQQAELRLFLYLYKNDKDSAGFCLSHTHIHTHIIQR